LVPEFYVLFLPLLYQLLISFASSVPWLLFVVLTLCSVSLLLQLLVHGLQTLEQMQDDFDSRQINAQVVLQATNSPQLYDLFLAIAQFSVSLL
jgi:hypothetical protein